MKIGIMLRHLEEHGGGVAVYTRNLLREMLNLYTPHEWVLIYPDDRYLGTYSKHSNVTEVVVKAPHVFLWDQFAVKKVEAREKLDLIFNPKYSVPLRAGCPSVFVSHGLDWYVMPWGSRFLDRLSHKYLFPRYAKKANAIIAVSDTTKEHLIEYLGIEEERIHTVYHAVGDMFRKEIPKEKIESVLRQFRLPNRYYLYVGQIYPPKNFGRLLRAYAQVGPDQGIPLVVAGEHTWMSGDEIALINELKLQKWVVWTHWVEHDKLPAIYRGAEALLLPSLYESFGMPILEAMACGCPVITSNRFGTLEVAGDAAVLVDPTDVASIAGGMRRVLFNHDERARLIEAGHKRADQFTWKSAAEGTLHVLESVLARSVS